VRCGRVLRKQTVLKADHYPSCHNTKLPEIVDGAPNFRQPRDDLPIYGTAMPTHAGLLAVCARVSARGAPVVWHNLRQEPCVYIHGRPFCVKERDNPFKALENKGVAASDVEQAEVTLKLEVLEEARRCGGRLLVLDESVPSEGGLCAKGELVHYYEEHVHAAAVWTPRELYEHAKLQLTTPLTYHRVPITDEVAPQEEDFDAIARHMREAHAADAASVYVFNCALGRGRTTTGLCTACLTWRAIAGDGQKAQWDMGGVRAMGAGGGMDYSWGEFVAVRTLCALMPSGNERKAFADRVIDQCAHMQNLRLDVAAKKEVVDNEKEKAKKRDAALVTGKKYLERYLYLVLYEGYVCCCLDTRSSVYSPPGDGRAPLRFKEWLDQVMGDTLYSALDGLQLQ